MQYTIAQDYYVPEFNIELYEGGTVQDGDLEPDLTAQLVCNGVLVSDSPTAIEAEEAAVEDEADETPFDDETDEAPVDDEADDSGS